MHDESPPITRCSFALVAGALAVTALLYHCPALLNAGAINSDAAVVGLQAMHMLRGEWSVFSWGLGYQSSLEAALAAPVFALTGPSPLALMLVTLSGHLLVIVLTFAVLERRLGVWPAALCTLAIVFTPWAVNWTAIYPPRQWSITLVAASVWLLDGASGAKRPLLRLGIGICCYMVALAAEVFALVFAPGIAVLALLCAADEPRDRRLLIRRITACALGFVPGLLLVLLIRLSPLATTSPAALALDRIGQNLGLLWDQCLPFSLGYAWMIDNELPARRTVELAPMPWRMLLIAGGWSLIAGIVVGAALVRSRLPWKQRRLGVFGGIVAAATIGGFVFSVMPADVWSARYLGPLFVAAPFALAPVASWLGARRFAVAIAPYVIVAAIGGWRGYGLWVDGVLPHRTGEAVATEEHALGQFLIDRGIRYAAADYWLAYRLTFLLNERVIVVPLDPGEDRYPPYRERFMNCQRGALIFHAAYPRADPSRYRRHFQERGIVHEALSIGGFSVLIYDRVPTGQRG